MTDRAQKQRLMNPPSRWLFLMLEFAGVGYRPQHKYINLMKVYIFYMYFTFIFQIFLIIAAWIYEDNDWDSSVELIHYFLESLNVIVKMFNFLFRYKEVRELLKFADEIKELCKSDPDNQPLIEESEKTEYKVSKKIIFVSNGVPVLFLICIWLSYMVTGLQKSALLYWVPFDSQRYFWSAVTFQIIIYATPFRIFVCFIGFNILIVKASVTYMKILQRLLTTREAKANKRLFTYILHQKINRLVSLTNKLLSGQFLLEISLSAVQLSLRIFAFIKVMLTGNGELMVSGGILVFSMSSPFVISCVGEMIKSESEKIFEAAYDNVWYEEEEKTKKELILVLRASERPHSLHYRHLITFNMEQFGGLVQATYSYLTVIFGLAS